MTEKFSAALDDLVGKRVQVIVSAGTFCRISGNLDSLGSGFYGVGVGDNVVVQFTPPYVSRITGNNIVIGEKPRKAPNPLRDMECRSAD